MTETELKIRTYKDLRDQWGDKQRYARIKREEHGYEPYGHEYVWWRNLIIGISLRIYHLEKNNNK
jgi:hypothetical protein